MTEPQPMTVPDWMEPRGWEICYFHLDGRVRWGITPPKPLDGWTRRRRRVYAGVWEDDLPGNAPRPVTPDSFNFGETIKESA